TARLVAEKAQPKADVFWSSDTSRAVALVDRELAASFVPGSAATIPARYKDANGRWIGFAARIRVLLYNTDKVKTSDAPRSILEQEGDNPLGTPLMPNVALLVQGAPHPDAGKQFIEFLVSAEAEKILAESDAAQFPLHTRVAGPKLLPPLDAIRVMDVDYLE